MPDVSAVDLGQALAGFAVTVEMGGQTYIGRLADPEQVADTALSVLGHRRFADEPDHPGPLEDPELIAAQAILDALAPLEAADPAAVLRVLRWLRERYDL